MYLTEEEEICFCFIRQPEVSRITSIPKSSIPVEIAEGNFPVPAEITTRSRAWLKSEIHDWMRQKLEERDIRREEIKKKKEKEEENE